MIKKKCYQSTFSKLNQWKLFKNSTRIHQLKYAIKTEHFEPNPWFFEWTQHHSCTLTLGIVCLCCLANKAPGWGAGLEGCGGNLDWRRSTDAGPIANHLCWWGGGAAEVESLGMDMVLPAFHPFWETSTWAVLLLLMLSMIDTIHYLQVYDWSARRITRDWLVAYLLSVIHRYRGRRWGGGWPAGGCTVRRLRPSFDNLMQSTKT